MSTSEQMSESDQQHVLEINKLIEESLREDLAKLNPSSGECRIHRVPKRLRDLDDKAFTPQIVSIGPYHHKKGEREIMEDGKKRYLKDFLQWSEVSMGDFIELVKKSKTKLLNCYAETIRLSDEEFIKIILVDAAFIIMLLLYNWAGAASKHDLIFQTPHIINNVCLDMCLLENQLPFFILEDMLRQCNIINHKGLDKEFTSLREVERPILSLTHRFFHTKWNSWVTDDCLEVVIKSPKIEHFLDFLRICQQPPEANDPRKKVDKLYVPSVTELQQAGVKVVQRSSKNLNDIKFNKDEGILEIPQLVVEDTTEILFRNLQAFEQCHYRKTYVSDYVCLMGYLAETPQDVKILVQNEILDNWLPSAEAASVLFKNLEKENVISSSNFLFAGVLADLKTYCKNPWPRLKVTLKQQYFNNPWASISVFAAAILFLLTVAQTVLSVLQV